MAHCIALHRIASHGSVTRNKCSTSTNDLGADGYLQGYHVRGTVRTKDAAKLQTLNSLGQALPGVHD